MNGLWTRFAAWREHQQLTLSERREDRADQWHEVFLRLKLLPWPPIERPTLGQAVALGLAMLAGFWLRGVAW